jgi:hypothetical protein
MSRVQVALARPRDRNIIIYQIKMTQSETNLSVLAVYLEISGLILRKLMILSPSASASRSSYIAYIDFWNPSRNFSVNYQ